MLNCCDLNTYLFLWIKYTKVSEEKICIYLWFIKYMYYMFDKYLKTSNIIFKTNIFIYLYVYKTALQCMF